MKLAISNIAWEQHDDPDILELLRANGVRGIEVAPTKVWQEWRGASYQKAKAYRSMMRDKGFELPAMQAILFGKPELQLFDTTSHQSFLEHIKHVAELANGLGSKIMVFGAPKNRKRGQVPYGEAMKIAAEFFFKAGEICLQHECCIGLEHNPVEYGCDFATNVLDAKQLVEQVSHEGFKLHLDAAGIHMCGGKMVEMIKRAYVFAHYHISEPMLEPIVGGVVDHKSGIDILQELGYQGWVSIEMKQPNSNDLLKGSVQLVAQMLQSES